MKDMPSSHKILTAVATTSDLEIPEIFLGDLVYNVQDRKTYAHMFEINVNHNRYQLQQKCKHLSDRYDLVLLMDSDVVVTNESLNALMKQFNGDPLCIPTKETIDYSHICCACCLMKFDDWQQIDYINTYVDECQCTKIRRLFPNVRYCDGVVGHEHKSSNEITIVNGIPMPVGMRSVPKIRCADFAT